MHFTRVSRSKYEITQLCFSLYTFQNMKSFSFGFHFTNSSFATALGWISAKKPVIFTKYYLLAVWLIIRLFSLQLLINFQSLITYFASSFSDGVDADSKLLWRKKRKNVKADWFINSNQNLIHKQKRHGCEWHCRNK